MDSGVTWSRNIQGFPDTIINALLTTPSGRTFAATAAGVFYIDDPNTDSWHSFSDGLTAKNVLSLCINAKGYLFAGTDVSGVFKSTKTFGTTTHSKVARLEVLQDSVTVFDDGFGTITQLPNILKNNGEVAVWINGDITPAVAVFDKFVIMDPIFPIPIEPGKSQSIKIKYSFSPGGSHTAILHLRTPTQEDSIVVKGMFGLRGVEEDQRQRMLLSPAFPNPFSVSTNIPFVLTRPGLVRLEVADALGRVVAILVDAVVEAGSHQVNFTADGLHDGTYYVHLRAEGKSEVKLIVKTSEP